MDINQRPVGPALGDQVLWRETRFTIVEIDDTDFDDVFYAQTAWKPWERIIEITGRLRLQWDAAADAWIPVTEPAFVTKPALHRG